MQFRLSFSTFTQNLTKYNYMAENPELLAQLQQLLSHKKSKKYYSEKLKITEEYLEELLKELKLQEKEEFKELENLGYCKDCKPGDEIKKVNLEKGTLESTIEVDFEPKSDTELAKLHKVDLNKYKISTYWSKLKSNGKFTSSVFATLKKPVDYTPEDFTKFLSTWEPSKFYKEVKIYPVYYDVNGLEIKEEVDIELNIADFHLAKKTFQGDNLESKEFDYYRAITDLVTKVKANYNIRKLVFPIGNDMFHTDNAQNGTTNGTPQDVTVWYDEEYEKGFDILANSINYLVTQARQVEVILVQGNHDRTKGFFVAHALEVFFKGYKNIKFQRQHSVVKHTVVGDTFIGYHHGNSVKLESLPIQFATSPESSMAFGLAKYREIHTGDKHHYLAKEINGSGVRIQQVPSLSGTDRWHKDNGFINQIRAALAFVYHPTQGKIAEYEFRL